MTEDITQVSRKPRYPGYDGPDEDFLILVNGVDIGGTYWCVYNPAVSPGWGHDDGGIDGPSWASWGPRGLSCGHATREDAEEAQVRAYIANR